MARRRATRKFDTILEFLIDYQQAISKGTIQLPAGSYRGELANEIKLDLSIPEVGRVGPITAQVVFRSGDGLAALRLPEIPPEVHTAYGTAKEHTHSAIRPYIDCGLVVSVDDHNRKITDLEQQLTDQQQSHQILLQQSIENLKLEHEEQIRNMAEKMAAQQAAAVASGASGGSNSGQVFSRGFAIPSYEHIDPIAEGEVGGTDLQQFLLQAMAQQVTGLLVIEQGEQKRYGYFDKGGPVGWRSEPLIEKEVLGVLLYKFKQINAEQLQESLELMESKNLRQGEAFIQMGLMTFSQMVMVLGKQVDFILQQVRKMKDGIFSFYPLQDLPERFVPPKLNTVDILYREKFSFARRSVQDDIYRAYSKKLNTYLSLSEIGKAVIPQISFNKGERQLTKIIVSKSWRMREVFSVSPMSKGNTSAYIWSFYQLGFFDFAQQEDSSRTEARYAGRILRKKRQLHGGSVFDILEVHWISLPQEIEDAYHRLVATFDPAQNSGMPKKFHEESNDILQQIHDAYEILSDDKKRREYRLKIIEKDMILQSAALLVKKGEMAILRRDKREACNCFSKAVELIPTSKEYREGLRRAAAVGSMA